MMFLRGSLVLIELVSVLISHYYDVNRGSNLLYMLHNRKTNKNPLSLMCSITKINYIGKSIKTLMKNVIYIILTLDKIN